MELSKPILFMDFDDTILFTDAYRNNSSNQYPEIKKFDEHISLLLSMLLENCQVFIVSNGSEGWVQHASKLFFPTLCSIFENGINRNKPMIFSAQKAFGQKYKNTIQWKFSMFQKILLDNNCHIVPRHIISIGDANTEREALFSVLRNSFSMCSGTSIKMLEKPSLEILHKQHQFLIKNISQYLKNPNEMCDLKIDEILGGDFLMERNTHPLMFIPEKNSLFVFDGDSSSVEPSSKKPWVDTSDE